MSFKIVAIRYNTRLTTFVQLPETISKGLLWNRTQNGSYTMFDGIHVRKTCTFDGRFLVSPFVEISRWPIQTWLILSRFLPFAKASSHFQPTASLPYTCTNISGISVAVFPQFVAELVCTTSHSDYIQLAAVGLHCWSHAVHAVCRFSLCL